MSRFKINIHQMQEESNTFKEKYNQYKDEQDSLYKVALTVDGSWNDNNTSVFISCVENDKKDMDKFHDTIYHCIDSIDAFATKLDTLLSSNGVTDVEKNLSYDEDYCKKSVSILDSCIEELRIANSKIVESYTECSAFRTIQLVNSNIKSCMHSLETIEGGIETIQTGVENLVANTNSSIQSYDSVTIVDNNLKYNWSPVSYVKDYTDIFKRRTENRTSAENRVLDKKDASPEAVSSSAVLDSNSEQLKTTSSDVSVNIVNDNQATEETLTSKDDSKISTDASVGYTGPQSEMNVLESENSTIHQEIYRTENSGFIENDSTNVIENKEQDYEFGNESFHTDTSVNVSAKRDDYSSTDNHFNNSSNITITNSKEDYSANKGTVSVSGNIGSIGGLKTEKFDTSSNAFTSTGNSGIQLEGIGRMDTSTTTLNANPTRNVSLEKNNSFEE